MSYTTDPNDPRLGKGVDDGPIPQHDVYLVLSDEERAKGFVRPYRNSYVHVGIDPEMKGICLVKAGKNGCGTLTTMSRPISETYARDPKFYGATYCVGCQRHLPVDEFYWEGTIEKVGS